MTFSHDERVGRSIRAGEPLIEDWPEAPLLQLARDQSSAQTWWNTAAELGERGLHHAADAALFMAVGLTEEAAGKAAIFDRMALVLLKLGLTEQAESRARVAQRLRGQSNPGRVLELEGGSGWVISRGNDPQGFDAMLGGVTHNPLDQDPLRGHGPVLSVCDVSPQSGARQDFSFAVMDESGPLVLVVCEVTGDGMMIRGEAAVQLTRLRDLVPDWAMDLAIDQLAQVTRWSGAEKVLVEDDGSVPLRRWFDVQPCKIYRMSYCQIDLAKPLDIIRHDYRETHRQQVAWGRKHLRVEKVSNPALLYDGFCELYRTGNHLRPQFTRQSLGQPGIGLFAAWDGADLASIVAVSDFGGTCYYTAGARMGGSKKPLTHVLIDAAIADAQARGMARFSFGALHLDNAAGEKLKGIAGFKRGFVAHSQPVNWVTVKA